MTQNVTVRIHLKMSTCYRNHPKFGSCSHVEKYVAEPMQIDCKLDNFHAIWEL